MWMWNIIPKAIKDKNHKRFKKVSDAQTRNYLEYHEMHNRMRIGLLFLNKRADEHERGLETVQMIEKKIKEVQDDERYGIEADHEGYYDQMKEDLKKIRQTICHHRDHEPGPWSKGYVWALSTGYRSDAEGLRRGDNKFLEEE